MSSPIGRLFAKDETSPFARIWAQNLVGVPAQRLSEPPLQLVGGTDVVSMVPEDWSEEGLFSPQDSHVQGLPPKQTKPKSLLHASVSGLFRSGGGTGRFVPYLLTTFLAALIASIFVLELPKFWSVAANQPSSVIAQPLRANSFDERFDSYPQTSTRAAQIATREATPIETPHSEISTPSADPWANTVNRSVVPVARVSPATPPPPAVETLAPPDPVPVTAPPPANPTPAVIAPSATDATPSPQSPAIKSVKTVRIEVEKKAPTERAKPARPLGAEEIETLLKQGDDFVAVGDFVSARLVYRRVAEADDARGALAFAATYDPIVLTKIHAKGATPDITKAREWYAKARDLGSPGATARLEALASSAR
jgi:hypothetical protein